MLAEMFEPRLLSSPWGKRIYVLGLMVFNIVEPGDQKKRYATEQPGSLWMPQTPPCSWGFKVLGLSCWVYFVVFGGETKLRVWRVDIYSGGEFGV